MPAQDEETAEGVGAHPPDVQRDDVRARCAVGAERRIGIAVELESLDLDVVAVRGPAHERHRPAERVEGDGLDGGTVDRLAAVDLSPVAERRIGLAGGGQPGVERPAPEEDRPVGRHGEMDELAEVGAQRRVRDAVVAEAPVEVAGRREPADLRRVVLEGPLGDVDGVVRPHRDVLLVVGVDAAVRAEGRVQRPVRVAALHAPADAEDQAVDGVDADAVRRTGASSPATGCCSARTRWRARRRRAALRGTTREPSFGWRALTRATVRPLDWRTAPSTAGAV